MTSPTIWLTKFRRVKVGQANFDPLIGVGGPADTQAVAVSDIPDNSGEHLARSCRKPSLAWICANC